MLQTAVKIFSLHYSLSNFTQIHHNLAKYSARECHQAMVLCNSGSSELMTKSTDCIGWTGFLNKFWSINMLIQIKMLITLNYKKTSMSVMSVFIQVMSVFIMIITGMWSKLWLCVSAFTYPQALILPHWHLHRDLQEYKMLIFTAVITQDSLSY